MAITAIKRNVSDGRNKDFGGEQELTARNIKLIIHLLVKNQFCYPMSDRLDESSQTFSHR